MWSQLKNGYQEAPGGGLVVEQEPWLAAEHYSVGDREPRPSVSDVSLKVLLISSHVTVLTHIYELIALIISTLMGNILLNILLWTALFFYLLLSLDAVAIAS